MPMSESDLEGEPLELVTPGPEIGRSSVGARSELGEAVRQWPGAGPVGLGDFSQPGQAPCKNWGRLLFARLGVL